MDESSAQGLCIRQGAVTEQGFTFCGQREGEAWLEWGAIAFGSSCV